MDSPTTILVILGEQGERSALSAILQKQGCHTLATSNPEQGLNWINHSIQLVITDSFLGHQKGFELLKTGKTRHPHLPFIVVTAAADIDSALKALELGADDYLTRPINPQELLPLVDRYLRTSQKRHEQTEPPLNILNSGHLYGGFQKIIARSKVMHDIFDQANRAAQTDSTILIRGESGTGKELIAEAIHQNSPRSNGPFITVNMAAIPEHLVESELFGHVIGAFTGATADRIGRFEAANSGTLFIDEIGDLQLASQAKLLRVLENQTVTPVGSNEERKVEVRVVGATNCNLSKLMQQGRFRKDLYYRLNVLSISLPPLRERRDDIRLLTETFLDELCRENHRPKLHLDPDLMNFLENFDWPGNVRQLRNSVESMVVLADDETLTLDNLPSHLCSTKSSDNDVEIHVPMHTTLEDLERNAIIQSLEHFEGNRTRAANALGISVRTLQRRLKAWGMDKDKIPENSR